MDPLHPHDPPAIGPFRLLGRLGEDAGTRRYLAEAADGTEATLAVARPERAADPLFRDAFARRVAAVRTWPRRRCRTARGGAVGGRRPPHPHDPRRAAGNRPRRGAGPAGALAADVARALAALHAAGAAHGPLTPAGVLCTEDGAVLAGPPRHRRRRRRPEGAGRVRLGGAGRRTGGRTGVPLHLRRLVQVCADPDPSLRPSAADLVRMLGAPPAETAPRGAGGGRPAGCSRRWPARWRWPSPPRRCSCCATAPSLPREAPRRRPPHRPTPAWTPPATRRPPACPTPSRPTALPSPPAATSWRSAPTGTASLCGTGGRRPRSRTWPARSTSRRPRSSPPAGVHARRPGAPRRGGRGRTAVLYDLPAGEATDLLGPPEEGTLAPDPPDVESVGVGPGGRVAAGLGGGGTPVFEPGAAEPAIELETGLVFHAEFLDAERVATFGRGSITVWDTGTGESLHTVRPASDFLFALVPGTDDVVYIDRDRAVRWNLAERSETASFPLEGHGDYGDPFVAGLVMDPAGERVFLSWGGDVDGDVRLKNQVWDMATGEDVLPEGTPHLLDVAFHPAAARSPPSPRTAGSPSSTPTPSRRWTSSSRGRPSSGAEPVPRSRQAAAGRDRGASGARRPPRRWPARA
ncbi:WD40 repeat domain-containing protein [Nocardiopsis composta]